MTGAARKTRVTEQEEVEEIDLTQLSPGDPIPLHIELATRAPDALLTRKEAAAFLRLSQSTLATWATTGKHSLPYFRVGGRTRYRLGDLLKWLEQQRRV